MKAPLVSAVACVLALGRPVLALTTQCVSSSSALYTALGNAAFNGDDNEVRLEIGTYTVSTSGPPPLGKFQYYDIVPTGKSFSLLGGYAPGTACSARVLNPTNTILDGAGFSQVLEIYVTGSGSALLEGVTIQNGSVTSGTAGAYVSSTSGPATIRFCIAKNNTGTPGNGTGLALVALGSGGTAVASNNLAFSNTYGLTASSNTSATVTNNTITGNTTGGLEFGTIPVINVSNNILYGNGVDLGSNGGPILLNNDVNTISGSIDAGSSGNINSPPLFVGASDFHLQNASPCVNHGIDTPPGGLPSQDLDGSPRKFGTHVDMGAYENQNVVPVELVTFTAD